MYDSDGTKKININHKLLSLDLVAGHVLLFYEKFIAISPTTGKHQNYTVDNSSIILSSQHGNNEK